MAVLGKTLLMSATLAAAAACTASSDDVRPPADELFFPTGLAISPDESVLFVISANSELRYDSGTISVVDLDTVDATVDAWLSSGDVPAGCNRDLSFAGTIECEEAPYLLTESGARTGNFSSTLAFQELGGGDLRLVVPVRGDPSVTWIDWSASDRTLSCSDSGGFALCDDAHRLTRIRNDSDLPQIPEEPFGVFVDSQNEFAVVTHFTTGTVTLVDMPLDGTPILADALTGIFASDPNNGQRGAVAVAGRTPNQPGDRVYVTSRSDGRIQTFTVGRQAGQLPVLLPTDYFFLNGIGENEGGTDARAMAFGAGGDLAYVVNREPPSVALVDTSLTDGGVPRNVILGGTDICREASAIAVGDVGEGERAFVSCFQDGEIYVIDPTGSGRVEAVTTVGRGPFGVAVSPTRRRLYVSNFFENTIAVLDLTPGTTSQYRVAMRIGLSEDQTP
jgi:DNA-binding beta-propeller fold protein YncE